jgi:hypothetical protein
VKESKGLAEESKCLLLLIKESCKCLDLRLTEISIMPTTVRPVWTHSTTFLADLHRGRRRAVPVGQRRSRATKIPIAGAMAEANFSRHPESGKFAVIQRRRKSKCKN